MGPPILSAWARAVAGYAARHSTRASRPPETIERISAPLPVLRTLASRSHPRFVRLVPSACSPVRLSSLKMLLRFDKGLRDL
jgi:hypothetical protein